LATENSEKDEKNGFSVIALCDVMPEIKGGDTHQEDKIKLTWTLGEEKSEFVFDGRFDKNKILGTPVPGNETLEETLPKILGNNFNTNTKRLKIKFDETSDDAKNTFRMPYTGIWKDYEFDVRIDTLPV